jgi:amino acid adenylation domain-containing protein/non-ribosomal peptide synthase protein (TIGR01720 family)
MADNTNVKKIYALSPMQEGMLFHAVMAKDSRAYFEQLSHDIQGKVTIATFQKAFNLLIAKYDVFRTIFIYDQINRPKQIVLKERQAQVHFEDLSQWEDAARVRYIGEYREQDIRKGFDLSGDLLIRLAILKTAPDRYKVIWSFHHILLDGWCLGIIFKDFYHFYQAVEEARPVKLVEPYPYSNYIKWLEKQDKEAATEYWRNYLAGYERQAGLPKRSNAKPTGYLLKSLNVNFGAELTRNLKQVATTHGVTLNTVFQSIWGVLLHKYNKTSDVVFGAVVSGRAAGILGIEKMVGLLINTIPVRIVSEDDDSFACLIKRVQIAAAAAEKHSYLPLVDIQAQTPLQQQLIENIIAFENYPFEAEFGEANNNFKLQLDEVEFFEQTSYDFNIIVGLEKELAIRFSFNGLVYDEALIQNVAGHFQEIARAVAAAPQMRLAEIEMLTGAERDRILREFNATASRYPHDQTIQELFAAQVARTPDNIALVYEDQQMTYAELNRRANQLARLLRQKGVQAETIVGIMVERSVEMVVAILGILKAGGAYLPIDPAYPAERIRFMLADSGTGILLTQTGLRDKCNFAGELIPLDNGRIYDRAVGTEPDNCNQPQDLAYLIYTSGTTGIPKGVMIEHRNLVRLMFNDKNPFDFSHNDVWTMFHSYCFDFSVWEMYGALLYGGKLVIVPKITAQDTQEYLKLLKREKVTILNQTPGAFYNLIHEELGVSGRELCLRYVIFGGESLRPGKLKNWLKKYPETKLINMYGITETTVHVTFKEITPLEIDQNVSNIGRPLPTLTAYIMDQQLKLQPIGVAGELCVGGAGVGRGYFKQPQLTAEKFILNPYKFNERLYKSGDLARYLPNGELEYLGRIDHQVKIRGFRIELGEIENRLVKLKAVKAAVVIAKEDANGNKYLCAYLVATEKLTVSELRESLAREIPEYMIPSYFVPLQQLPLTSNGKIDRAALPEPEEKPETGADYEGPRNEIEAKLVEIWQSVLGVSEVGIHDSFFDLGGDSIKALQVSARLQSQQFKIELKELFQHPTVGELSGYVIPLRRRAEHGNVVGKVELTPIQYWFFTQKMSEPQRLVQTMILYRATGFEERLLRQVFDKIVAHHDALRMVYQAQGEEFTQYNRGTQGAGYSLEIIDLHNEAGYEPKINAAATRIRNSIDLKNGPLVKLGLFKTGQGDHLLIAIHHLVVDGVSWRIILEDLAVAYGQVSHGSPIRLPAKTDSYQEWAQRQLEFSKSSALRKEAIHWQRLESVGVEKLPRDSEVRTSLVKDSRVLRLTLTTAETEQLLKQVNRAYHTEINDILLTALGRAVHDWCGAGKVLISLEGHGREAIIPNINLTRTVGWFTTIYPVLLDLTEVADLSWLIRTVKESIRRIPNKGIGYGILKYLARDECRDTLGFTLNPEISFNYLGQFDRDSNTGIFELSGISGGQEDGNRERQYSLDIYGIVTGGRLELSFSYNRKEYREETIREFVNGYQKRLLEIVEHCLSRETATLTPSDLGDKELSLSELAKLTLQFGAKIQSIYPLSPMQSGMLFYSLLDRKSEFYFEQVSFDFKGDFDPKLFERSFNILMQRHEVLRTNFISRDLSQPRQVVLIEKQLKIYLQDLESRNDGERQALIAAYKQKDRERGFDLSSDGLIRLAVLKTGPESHTVIWSYHHILMDGWSAGTIIKELFQIYQAMKEGRLLKLEPVPLYRHYIDWLENQDEEVARQYWRKYLHNYERNAVLPKKASPGKTGYRMRSIHFRFSEAQTRQLEQTASDHGVTLNTVFQSIWGVLLQKYNNLNDVVFGAVVSGRPAEIAGIEKMVGLFINTIPVRIQGEGNTGFSTLIKAAQTAALESEKYSYRSLTEIQGDTLLKQNIFDHIVVFENYPVEKEILEFNVTPSALQIGRVEVFDQTNYDLNVVVILGKELEVELNFNELIYDEKLLQRVGEHFWELARAVIARPEIRLAELEMLTEAERRQVLYEFNHTTAEYPRGRTYQELFQEQVVKTPDAVAVVCDERQLTYRELEERSNQIAQLLREKGVERDGLVGLLMDRSGDMLAAILGILKAGGAYLPLEPNEPLSRIKTIITNSRTGYLLTKSNVIKDRNQFYAAMADRTQLSQIIYLDQILHAGEENSLFRTYKLAQWISEGNYPEVAERVPFYYENRVISHEEYRLKAISFNRWFKDHPLGTKRNYGIILKNPVNIMIAITALRLDNLPFVVIDPKLKLDQITEMVVSNGIEMLISDSDYLDEVDQLLWASQELNSYVIMDDGNLRGNGKEQSFKTLWNIVAAESAEAINDYGWQNSYNGEKFSLEEMQEYIANFIEKLQPYLNQDSRVFDIGCGHGLALFELAPKVKEYFATDLSEVIIAKNRSRVAKEKLDNVILETAAAGEIHELNAEGYNIVVCCSVIHYFPNTVYLETVIREAINVLGDQGVIYLDDLMDWEKKRELMDSVLTYKRNNPLSRAKLDWSNDLFIHKDFFKLLQKNCPEIVEIEISDKLGKIENELTKFRYDVLLKIDKKCRKGNESKPASKNRYFSKDIRGYHLRGEPNLTGNIPEAEMRKVNKIGSVCDITDIDGYPTGSVTLINKPSDLSYVIYTSGSTGNPKGVMVEHAGMINHIYAKIADLEISKKSIIAQNAAHCFDISVWQFLAPLVCGGTTVIYGNNDILKPRQFMNKLREAQISILEVVPSYLEILLDAVEEDGNRFEFLEYLLVTGEAIKSGLVEKWFNLCPDCKLVNAYGPTEASDDITHYIMDKYPGTGNISIGKPIQNLKIYIIDDTMKLCPVGVKGEIAVAGIGVGRGYLNDREKTEKVFRDDPFSDEGKIRLYKTGDLGRWRPDGNIEFFGRKDYQVKIRGFRIELGEIEYQLLQNETIKAAVVLDREDDHGDKALCAYVVAGQTLDIVKLQDELKESLPEYMIPSYFIQLDRLPLTANGKVDRKALPKPGGGNAAGVAYEAPGNKVEEQLTKIWSEVLGNERVGIGDNFFALGGHSLKATAVASRIYKELNVEVELRKIFELPTIKQLGQYLKTKASGNYEPINPVAKREYYEAAPAQKRMYMLRQIDLQGTGYNMPGAVLIEGKLERQRVESVFKQLIRRHETLRTSFQNKADQIVQIIAEESEFKVEYTESSGRDIDSMITEFVRPFDLSKAPLIRVGLVKLGEAKHLMMYDMHHIISDGVSINILVNDFRDLYESRELKPLRIQYKDYAQWHNKLLLSEKYQKQEKYWLDVFRGELPALNLPLDYARPAGKSFDGDMLEFLLDKELTSKLVKIAQDSGSTLYMVLLAALNILLSKYSGQADIIIGSPVAGRPHADLEQVIGMFINILVMRNRPEGERHFLEFLREVKENALTAYENQDYQFNDLVDKLHLKRDLSKNPLFEVAFAVQNFEETELVIEGLTCTDYHREDQMAKLDLAFFAYEKKEEILMVLQYCSGIFARETMEKLARNFTKILRQIGADPTVLIGDIGIDYNVSFVKKVEFENEFDFR